MKKQTNLVTNFLKCMDLMDEGDFRKILAHLGTFQALYMELSRQLDKFIKSGDRASMELETSDLKDICDLTLPRLQNWEQKANHNRLKKELFSCERLDNEVFKNWARESTDLFSVIAKIRCFLSVMSYNYCVLEAYDLQWKQNHDVDMANMFLKTLKQYARNKYEG